MQEKRGLIILDNQKPGKRLDKTLANVVENKIEICFYFLFRGIILILLVFCLLAIIGFYPFLQELGIYKQFLLLALVLSFVFLSYILQVHKTILKGFQIIGRKLQALIVKTILTFRSSIIKMIMTVLLIKRFSKSPLVWIFIGSAILSTFACTFWLLPN